MHIKRALHTLRRAGERVLDTILPPKARSARTKERSLAELPLEPLAIRCQERRILTLTRYNEPAIADLIQALKYERSAHAAALAASLLADFLREEIHTLRLLGDLPVVLAPVPLHRARQRERGFNQVSRILSHLPREFHDGTLSLVAPQLLVRTRHTPAQAKLSRAARLINVSGAFSLSHPLRSPVHVILIDDVATTGATLLHAAAPLEAAGIPHTLLALARA